MSLTFLALVAAPAAAFSQDEGPRMWSDLAETRSFSAQQGNQGRGQGGQVIEEWYTPRLRASLALYGRVSFPSDTNVTVDGLWYSDFFSPGYGVSLEGDLLSYVSPGWGMGGYLSVGWDRFEGQRINFINGDFAQPDHMDLTTVIVGGKVVQRYSPFFLWDGHMGIGVVHYSTVHWSGFDATIPGPFSNEQLFSSTSTVVGELGGRVAFGNPHIEADLGFGLRFMGGPRRGHDVNSNIEPDILVTYMLELGLTVRF